MIHNHLFTFGMCNLHHIKMYWDEMFRMMTCVRDNIAYLTVRLHFQRDNVPRRKMLNVRDSLPGT
jgi:hypothetical protein